MYIQYTLINSISQYCWLSNGKNPSTEECSPGRRRGLALRGRAPDAPRLPGGRGGQQRPGGGETRPCPGVGGASVM